MRKNYCCQKETSNPRPKRDNLWSSSNVRSKDREPADNPLSAGLVLLDFWLVGNTLDVSEHFARHEVGRCAQAPKVAGHERPDAAVHPAVLEDEVGISHTTVPDHLQEFAERL